MPNRESRTPNSTPALAADTPGLNDAAAIDVAGRRRMLSQRLAKACMMRAWGIDAPAVRKEFTGMYAASASP